MANLTLIADRFGNSNAAYNFNGTNSKIDVPYDAGLNCSTITVSAWGKLTSDNGKSNVLCNRWSGTNKTWVSEWNVLKTGFAVKVNSSELPMTHSSANLAIGQWYMFAGTYDGKVARAFLNGVLVDSQTISATGARLDQNVSPLCIGYLNDNPDGWFNGAMDDIRIYNAALSAAQIDSLYRLNGYPASAATAPNITTEPTAQTKTVGQSATFTVVASGTPTPTYQWRKNGVDISGATLASYTISSVSMSDTGLYSVVAINNQGSDTSSAVQLIVNPVLGLIAYYPFTGNANDSSGNNHNGIVSGASLISDRFGNANNAYDFDGVNNHIDIGDIGNIDDITISLWYKQDVVKTNNYLIGAGAPDNRFLVMYVRTQDTIPEYVVSRTTANTISGHSGTKTPNTSWHHMVLTRSG
ncbi:MAG: immunoglobulin domain-containing protein, partial [Fibrobacteres bacterium]|nr:immunoglobulin domain-containing protein [Fibrobacterota bacterium]